MKIVFPYNGDLYHGPIGRTLEKNSENSLWVLGTSNRPSRVDSPGAFGVLSLEFLAGAAYQFIGPPLGELRNRVEPMANLFGPAGTQLEREIQEAPSVLQKVAVLQTFLLNRLRGADSADAIVDHAISFIRSRKGLVTITELCALLGYSQRYVSMKFDRLVGLGPKTVAEIFRFQNRFTNLTRLASGLYGEISDDDYYDQAHFSKEFKRFTGLTPRDYSRSENRFLNHFQRLTSVPYKTISPTDNTLTLPIEGDEAGHSTRSFSRTLVNR